MPSLSFRASMLGCFWLAASLVSLAAYVPTNDHFHRISAGRQIVQDGELPFRDFLDPGYFATELGSAAVQRLFGDNLLGEIGLNVASIATGATLVLLLAYRVSGSWLMAIMAATAALLLRPRAYDYDKFLFYPLGMWLCWRTYDRDDSVNLALLAAGITLAAAFRYDNGVFIGVAAAIGMAAIHSVTSATYWRRLGVLVAFTGLFALPVLWFISTHGGLLDAFDQIATYAVREGTRTRVLRLPAISLDCGLDADLVTALVAYVLIALPIIAAWIVSRRTDVLRSGVTRGHIFCVIALCILLDLFILRDPVAARIGGMAGPPMVLLTLVAAPLTRTGRTSRLIVSLSCAVAVVAVLTQLNTAGVVRRLDLSRAAAAVAARARSPVPLENLPPQISGLVAYLRDCTAPNQRVMLTWFAPDIHFFSQRSFAGSVDYFGGHWSEPRFQRRILQKIESEMVPLVVRHENPGESPFSAVYPLIESYLREHYVDAGESHFSDAESKENSYRVWIHKAWRAKRDWKDTTLPCLTESDAMEPAGRAASPSYRADTATDRAGGRADPARTRTQPE